MVAFIQKAHGCIFFYNAIEGQEAQLAISDSRSVLQEQRCTTKARRYRFLKQSEEKKTYPLPGTKENPIVQVDTGRNYYPTSFKFYLFALLFQEPRKSTPWGLTFSPEALREQAKLSKTHPPLPVVLERTQWLFPAFIVGKSFPICTYIWRGMLANHLGSSNHFVF